MASSWLRVLKGNVFSGFTDEQPGAWHSLSPELLLVAEFIREISSQPAEPPFVSISALRTIFYLLGDFDQILVKAHFSRGK